MRKKWLGAFRRRLAGAAFTTHYCSHYMCDVSRKSSAWKHEERESRMKNQLNSFLNGLGYSVVSSKRMHLLEQRSREGACRFPIAVAPGSFCSVNARLQAQWLFC
jgi:hypothetical protein